MSYYEFSIIQLWIICFCSVLSHPAWGDGRTYGGNEAVAWNWELAQRCEEGGIMLGRKDVLQGSRRKVSKINFKKSKNEQSKSGKVSFWISKSRKVEKQKVEKWKRRLCEFRKVEKYTFWFFIFWLFEFLPDAFPAEHAQLKVQKLNPWDREGRRKAEKSKRWKGGRKVKKSKSILFGFHLLTFWIFAGCLSSWTCTAKSTKIEPLRSRGKKNSQKPEKSKRWKGRREVKKSKSILFGFHLLSFWIFAGCLSNWKCAAKSTKLEPLRVEREEEKPKSRQVEKVRGKKKSRKVEKYTFWLFTFWLLEFLRDAFPAEHAQLFFPA